MQTIPRIDDPQDVRKAYIAMVQIYGTDIFREPRRALGCLADMAPRLDREYRNFSQALQTGIPALLQSGEMEGGDLNEKGKQAAGLLRQCGLEDEEALVMVENLGAALNLRLAIRPDYSKGEEIPYAPQETPSIREAINSMNHIRWFLNHQENYRWRSGEDQIVQLRQMMSHPGKFRSQIETKYKELVHRFGNNPYEEYVLLEGDPKEGAFESNSFEDYFIIIGGMPVPVGFARQYSDKEIQEANQSWKKKKKNFNEKLENLTDRISKIKPSGDIRTAREYVFSGRKFAFSSVLLIAAFIYSIKDLAKTGLDYSVFWNYTKAWKFNVVGMIKQLGYLQYAGNYYVDTVLMLLGGLISVLLFISTVVTICKAGKLKGQGNSQARKLKKAMNALQSQIPDVLDSMERSMAGYLSKALDKVSFDKKDYRSIIQDAQTVVQGRIIKKPVSPVGRNLRRLMVIVVLLCVIFIAAKPSHTYRLGGQELAEFMASAGGTEHVAAGIVDGGEFGFTEMPNADLSAYSFVKFADATQSSYVDDKYTVWQALDQNPDTSWQEGAAGNGVGEYILMTFDQEYQVEYITLKLGKWQNDEYGENNRPSSLIFRMGSQEFTCEFPDDKREFILHLNHPVQASDLMIIINGAYPGSQWDDTCITDVGVYGIETSGMPISSE